MTTTLVILGATGDLAGRYLLPAIAHLHELGRPDEGIRVVGVARDDLDDAGFADHVRRRLESSRLTSDAVAREQMATRTRYLRGDVTDAQTLRDALTMATNRGWGAVEDAGPKDSDQDDVIALYLALPNRLFDDVVATLADCDLPPGLRLVVEKPFGEDLASARRLNEALARVLPEEQVFRVDHFLAKQTVLNLLGMRFANRILEPVWSNAHIVGVDIVFDETVNAEGRAGYYDQAGALRDMVQNHLLQLMSLVAMEPPLSMGQADLRNRKVDVLRAVRSMDREDVESRTERGRYTAGEVEGAPVHAYTEVNGVQPERGTETYTEVVLQIDNWRWAGVPFRLRTGKALNRDRREVVIRFAKVPHPVFSADGSAAAPNELRLQLDPDRMSLLLNVNGMGDPFDLETVTLDAELAQQDPSPYGQLLLAIIDGDTRLSARGDEAEEGWRIVEPILAAWAEGASPLQDYAAGSDGPVA